MRPIESRPGPRLRLMAARGVAVLVALGALSGCAAGDDGRVVSTGSERGADTAHPDHQGIVPNESIAGVRLRMGRAAVTRLLGAPEAVRRSDLHFGWTTLVYRSRGLRVTLDEGGAVWETSRRSLRNSADPAGLESVPASRRCAKPFRHWRVVPTVVQPATGAGARASLFPAKRAPTRSTRWPTAESSA